MRCTRPHPSFQIAFPLRVLRVLCGKLPLSGFRTQLPSSALSASSAVKNLPTNENRPRAFRLQAGGISGLKMCGNPSGPGAGIVHFGRLSLGDSPKSSRPARRNTRAGPLESAANALTSPAACLSPNLWLGPLLQSSSIGPSVVTRDGPSLLKPSPPQAHSPRSSPAATQAPRTHPRPASISHPPTPQPETRRRTQPSRSLRLLAPDHTRRGGLERAAARAVEQAVARVRRGGTRHRRRVISLLHVQTLRDLFQHPPAAAGASQPCGACDQRAPKHTSNGMGGDPASFWSSLAAHESVPGRTLRRISHSARERDVRDIRIFTCRTHLARIDWLSSVAAVAVDSGFRKAWVVLVASHS